MWIYRLFYFVGGHTQRKVFKMKNKCLVGFCVLLVFGFVLAGCDTGTNNGGDDGDNAGGPRYVVLQFGQALKKGDLNTAKSYCTAESSMILDMALAFGEDLSTWGNDIVTATLEEEITGNTAVVYDKNNPSENRIDLVKQNGQWKIDLSNIMED
jgi:hypothetical protein